MKTNYFSILLILLIVSFSACNQSNNNSKINSDLDSDTVVISDEKFNEATQIFYSLPAPHEVASILIENQEISYDQEFLNPVDNAFKYNTNMSMAINLGIYTADLSYASLFEQNQTVISYMATSKKLAEELGILEAFSEETLESLEANINDRNAIQRIISETYMDSDAYLQENNREEIAAMIIIGGWIEGMYIAIQLSEKNATKNIPLVSSIVEQQLSLSLMVTFLEDYKKNQSIAILLTDINKLNNIFQNIETDITEDGEFTISQEDYSILCDELLLIRNKFVDNA